MIIHIILYVQMKESPRNESFADGSVGARVRLMVRGGCLPVRGSERMTWKYAVGYMKDGMNEYKLIKGYHVRSDEIEKKQ